MQIQIQRGFSHLGYDAVPFLPNISNQLPSDKASYSRRPKSSEKLLWEPQILQKCFLQNLQVHCMD